MVKKILLLAVLLSVIAISSHLTFASAERDCSQKQICAQPGDYMKYTAIVYGHNGTISYNFGNFVGPDTLKVTIMTSVSGQVINAQSTLNLKNTTLTNADGSKGAFFFMVLTPINPIEIAASPFKESTATYNNYQRSVYAIEESNGSDSQEVKIDKETGLLMVYKIQHVQVVSGQPVPIGTSFELTDTNIITSSDSQGTVDTTSNTNNPTIPTTVSNAPSSDSNTTISSPSDYSTIIYVGIGIAAVGAGVGIMIILKRKNKDAQSLPKTSE
ncbi:MAG TPA: hypothetical protein VEJ68_02670 [Candidatus Bathyarchaeia archaeon]|nr:hypothetical protein [Candidatus Bathyarchaeia archaeon]